MEKKKIYKGRLNGYVQDIVSIVQMREDLLKNAENDSWFEINGESAEVLYQYITAMENYISIQDYKVEEENK